jgi:hypothetical protein
MYKAQKNSNPAIYLYIHIQDDQKVSVHLLVTIQKVTNNVQSVSGKSEDIQLNLTAWQPTASARRTLDSR